MGAMGAVMFHFEVKSAPFFHCFSISARASRGVGVSPAYSPKTRTVFFMCSADSQTNPPAEGASGSEPS